MPIPDFQTIMLPLLERSSDGKVRSNAEYRDTLADHFNLTGKVDVRGVEVTEVSEEEFLALAGDASDQPETAEEVLETEDAE